MRLFDPLTCLSSSSFVIFLEVDFFFPRLHCACCVYKSIFTRYLEIMLAQIQKESLCTELLLFFALQRCSLCFHVKAPPSPPQNRHGSLASFMLPRRFQCLSSGIKIEQTHSARDSKTPSPVCVLRDAECVVQIVLFIASPWLLTRRCKRPRHLPQSLKYSPSLMTSCEPLGDGISISSSSVTATLPAFAHVELHSCIS